MLSIIIPTFNEEKYLAILLDSIRRQDYKEYEIVIADNSSIDNTRNIAEKYGCKIVIGGTPAKARNNGARAARNDNLFLDADVILPDGFISGFLKKIDDGKLDYASCRVEPFSANHDHRFVYMLKNYGNKLFRNHVSGQCLFVKRALFEKIDGFDESLFLGEEHELACRLARHGKGKLFMDIFVYNFPRRHELEGAYRTLFRDIYSEAYRMARGKLKHRLYNKEYGHY